MSASEEARAAIGARRARKKLRCRLGFHLTYGDSVGVNYGTEKTPIYFMETTMRCNDCDWTDDE